MLKPEVIAALGSLQTLSEIIEASEYLRRKAKQLSGEQVDKFHVGQRVQFPGKRGGVLQGIVKSLNRTTVTVEIQDPFQGPVTWRVAASLLAEART